MSIAAGTRLGAYRIIAPLGAGGMGQVYRAHDDRLNRDLAIKVLPPEFVGDADRRWRFENEARAASALNHPNVLHVYEIGSADGVFYIAMELVEGRTLRELVSAGPMPLKKLLDVAIPVSDGLAKAHAAGIVHRDLKPENVMISNDGFVKILDFGLAKLAGSSFSDPNSPTLAHVTESGALVGTVSYMSPEQASGRQADFRSDQFSLGTMLYEMAAGKRPFAKSSAAQTLTAIIESEPEPLNAIAPAVPPSLQRIIERCLSKEPEQRYHATADLARDLRDVREYGSQASGAAAAVTKRPRFGWRLGAAMAAGAIAVALLATLAAAKFLRKPTVEFVRLTFDRGMIWNARFAPDGETIVYGGAWAGKPFEIYSARVGAPEPRPLGIPNSDILAISPAGELAISLTPHFFQTFQMKGTLAHAPLGGGTPRPVLEGVQWADWAPDGKNLAVVREVAGRSRLEFPVGKVLYETGGWIGHVRVSPDGTLVALVNHPVYTDVSGSVVIVDTTGHRVASSKLWTDVEGVAWTPSGKEVWFSSSLSGTSTHTINALTPNGSQRVVMDFPADVKVQDIDRFGRLLFAREDVPFLITALPPGASAEQDASVFGNSVARDISPDGSTLLVLASTEGGANHAVYLRRFDGSAPARIGEGLPSDLSPDGTWALAVLPVPAPAQLFRIPTGIGEPAPLTRDQITHSWANIFPDGKRILFLGHSPGHGNQLFVQNISGGEPRAISPEGTAFQWHAIAPDNRRIAAWGPDHAITIYDADGGASVRTPLPGDDEPIRWTADGKSLYVFRRGEFPAKIYRANITTGEKTLWRELMPSDSAGLESILRIQITPDERAYAYSRVVRLSTLYVATGIR